MEETRMIKVTVEGKECSYPRGTAYRAIAADFQDQFPCDILLVNRDGKLCELHKVLDRECSLRMVTAQDRPPVIKNSSAQPWVWRLEFHSRLYCARET